MTIDQAVTSLFSVVTATITAITSNVWTATGFVSSLVLTGVAILRKLKH